MKELHRLRNSRFRKLCYIMAFCAGMCGMIVELLATRILAPFLGTSIITWTAILGVIMAGMAAGYRFGGWLADRNLKKQMVNLFFTGAALWIILIALVYTPVLMGILRGGLGNIYILSTGISLLFFFVPGFLLACVSPYLLRLMGTENEKLGMAAGTMSMMGTIGSIAGTFLGGFVLVSFMSTRAALMLVSLILTVAGCVYWYFPRVFITGKSVIMIWGMLLLTVYQVAYSGGESVDTKYATFYIWEGKSDYGDARYISNILRGGSQGFLYTDRPDELAIPALKFMADGVIPKNTERTLILGGGVFLVSRYLSEKYPEMKVETVEIDGKLREVAKELFYFEDRINHQVYTEDARMFVNRAEDGIYDYIIQDTFNNPSNIPWHLSTKEYFEEVKRILSRKGILSINIITTLDSDYFRHFYATVCSVFPHTVVFGRKEKEDSRVENIIIAASLEKSEKLWEQSDENYEVKGVFQSMEKPLTDAFCPIEYLTLDFAY